MKSTYGIDHDLVEVKFDVEALNIDVDTIIPIGLILNELISNAFKYAFSDGRAGEWIISLCEDNSRLALIFQDDGVGSSQDVTQSGTFGTQMIRSLAMKLEAELSVNFDKGTKISLFISNYKLV